MNLGLRPATTARTQRSSLRGAIRSTAILLLVGSHAFAAAVAKPPSVTLDVKDADVRVVLKAIQKQCGIKNLVIDPDVTGSGTFLFHQLPCNAALNTVMRTTGLAAKTYSNSVVTVHHR